MNAVKPQTIFGFEELRKRLGLNQAEMANRMGLGSRAYFTLEQEPDAINIRHIKLAEMVALEAAVDRQDPTLPPERIRELVRKYAMLAFPKETAMSSRKPVLAVREAISAFEQKVSQGRLSGRELVDQVQTALVALRNAVEDIDSRLSIEEMNRALHRNELPPGSL
jgi:DNA-binding XRE family transcriptional regulator